MDGVWRKDLVWSFYKDYINGITSAQHGNKIRERENKKSCNL